MAGRLLPAEFSRCHFRDATAKFHQILFSSCFFWVAEMLPTPPPPAQTCAGGGCERNAGLINSSLIFPALQAKGRSLSSLPDTAGLSQHSQPSPAKPQLPFLWDLGKRALSFSLPSNQGERSWLIQKINTNRGRDKGVSLGQLLLCECLSCPPQAFLKILSIPGRLDFLPTSGFLPRFGFTSQNLTRIWCCGRGRRKGETKHEEMRE